MPRRTSGSIYESKPVNPAYPSKAFPPIRPEYPTYQSSYDTYQSRQFPEYGYPASGMPGGGYGSSMPPHMSDGGDGRSRRRRGNLPKATTDILRSWFQKHLDHPYPTDEEKQMLIMQTGLSMNQVWNSSLLSMLLLTWNRSVTGSSMLEDGICPPCVRPEMFEIKKKRRNDSNDRDHNWVMTPCMTSETTSIYRSVGPLAQKSIHD
jgi:hypothetical protein